MNRRPTRPLAIAALLTIAVAGCGVRLQDAPQPIEQTTQEPRPTPTIDHTVSPSPPTPTLSPGPPVEDRADRVHAPGRHCVTGQ